MPASGFVLLTWFYSFSDFAVAAKLLPSHWARQFGLQPTSATEQRNGFMLPLDRRVRSGCCPGQVGVFVLSLHVESC